MLEVVNVPTLTGAVECWMDIQRGTYPKISAIPDIIKIGETLSVLVYLKDVKNEYDLVVRDCWAYDNEVANCKIKNISIPNNYFKRTMVLNQLENFNYQTEMDAHARRNFSVAGKSQQALETLVLLLCFTTHFMLLSSLIKVKYS